MNNYEEDANRLAGIPRGAGQTLAIARALGEAREEGFADGEANMRAGCANIAAGKAMELKGQVGHSVALVILDAIQRKGYET